MRLNEALLIAEKVKDMLSPHCERIEIAGSIRRKKPEVKDIEIVAIPKPYDVGLFESGIATVVNNWKKVKGQLPCKYTQRILPEGIKLDLFFATKTNWGMIYAIRTGSEEYSHKVLARKWTSLGYRSQGGHLYIDDKKIDFPEEKELFDLLNIKYQDPEFRT
jgi:DNA polymerase/3'-5' exonuclease PolX